MFLLGGCLTHRLTAAEAVHRAQEALGTARACRFILGIEVDTDLLKDSLSVEVWESPPDRLKVQVLTSVNPQLQEFAFGTDGSRSVSYSPGVNEAVVGPPDVVKMPLILDLLIRARREWIQSTDAQEARMIAVEREDGLVVYKVRAPLVQGGQAQYWVDARQWWVRQIVYENEVLGMGTVRVQEIECFDSLPGAEFDIEIPDGVTTTEVTVSSGRPLTREEAQMAVSFRLRTPTYLPSGTQFTVAYQVDKNMALVYTGERSFTLVQGPNVSSVPQEGMTIILVGGRQAKLVKDEEDGSMHLTWREEGLQFSIAGSLDQQELVRIAESVE